MEHDGDGEKVKFTNPYINNIYVGVNRPRRFLDE